eukprot:403360067
MESSMQNYSNFDLTFGQNLLSLSERNLAQQKQGNFIQDSTLNNEQLNQILPILKDINQQTLIKMTSSLIITNDAIQKLTQLLSNFQDENHLLFALLCLKSYIVQHKSLPPNKIAEIVVDLAKINNQYVKNPSLQPVIVGTCHDCILLIMFYSSVGQFQEILSGINEEFDAAQDADLLRELSLKIMRVGTSSDKDFEWIVEIFKNQKVMKFVLERLQKNDKIAQDFLLSNLQLEDKIPFNLVSYIQYGLINRMSQNQEVIQKLLLLFIANYPAEFVKEIQTSEFVSKLISIIETTEVNRLLNQNLLLQILLVQDKISPSELRDLYNAIKLTLKSDLFKESKEVHGYPTLDRDILHNATQKLIPILKHNHAEFQVLKDQGILLDLSHYIKTVTDVGMLKVILNLLHAVLQVNIEVTGSKANNNQIFGDLGGIEVLEDLQEHKSKAIFELAVKIITDNFEFEE